MTAPHDHDAVVPPTVGGFLSGAAERDATGNTPWARNLAREVVRVLRQAAERAPRSQQVHLGPSEVGTPCDRQVVGKLVREPKTNHVADPWPSIVGTAVHAWLADAFDLDNKLTRRHRWSTETRVTPHPEHSGTSDLYDWLEQAILDHKVLGETTLRKVKSKGGPPQRYTVQLYLYALGWMLRGQQVRRVGIIAYPRTGSSVEDVYVWEAPMDAAAAALLAWCFAALDRRKALAVEVAAGRLRLDQVDRTPSSDECYFCPFYRPDALERPGEGGCPGTVRA